MSAQSRLDGATSIVDTTHYKSQPVTLHGLINSLQLKVARKVLRKHCYGCFTT